MITQTFTICPGCGEIAEIRDRVVLSSTDGPVEHIRMMCIRWHHFVLPVAGLDQMSTLNPPAADTHPIVGNAS
ncbi:MAG: hypothetical protein ACRDSP_06690 [Pseudonocardiaceae bacterium]